MVISEIIHANIILVFDFQHRDLIFTRTIQRFMQMH